MVRIAPRLEEAITARLGEAEQVSEVVIHLEGLGRIDLTGAMVLKRIVEEVGQSGIPATLKGVPPQARELIDNVFGMLPNKSL